MNKSNSLISIDILRALAALGVFYYHQHIGKILAAYTHLNWLINTDNFGATYAVPLFFLISGYCIHLSNIKYLKIKQELPLKEYFKRRLLRIYPAYLAALVFSIAVNYITSNSKLPDATDVWVHVLLLQGFTVTYFNTINVVLWTISVEMAFYILYPAFYYIRLHYKISRAMIFALLVSTCSIGYFWTKSPLNYPQMFCAFNIWFAWCCGAFLAERNAFSTKILKSPVYLLLYGVIAVGMLILNNFPDTRLATIKYQLVILLWAIPLTWLIDHENWFKRHNSFTLKIILSIGLSSYSLYLFHDPLIFLKNYLVHLILPVSFQPAGMLLGILIIPVITWLSYIYIEKPFLTKKTTKLAEN